MLQSILGSLVLSVSLQVMAQNTVVNDEVNIAQSIGEHEVIAVDYPPFTTMDVDDHGINFSLLSQLISDHYDFKVKPLFLPPARAQLQVQSGRWCLSFFPPPESQQAYFVPLSQQKVVLGLFRRKENAPFSWDDLSELKGKNLAIMRYKREGDFHRQFINAGLNMVPIESVEQGFKMLKHKRVDLVFSNQFPDYLFKHPEINSQDFQFSNTPILEAQVGVYINQACKEQYQLLLPQPN
ncbi:substrate-binding periplasmic protein [Shewanella sp. HL-SH2]|uniref:substrate-binding periplasmic protein n=1 Tax=Shewanella sp. HL-SH2 TaxID=3436238 RepID=UPI003EBC6F60